MPAKRNKRVLSKIGIGLVLTGVVGVLVAIVMEIQTGEHIYWLIMKGSTILFGLGGPLLGIALAKRRK